MRIENEDGKIEGFEVPHISILTHPRPANEFKELRSVMGTAFLEKTGLSLHFDPKNKEAWLERKIKY